MNDESETPRERAYRLAFAVKVLWVRDERNSGDGKSPRPILARRGWIRSRASGGPGLWPGVDGAPSRRVSVCRGGGVDLVQGMGHHGFTSHFVGGRRRRDGAGRTGLTPASDVVRFAARPRHGGREQSGARSRPAGASLDIGKQRSPLKRRLLCRLRRSHYTADAPSGVHPFNRDAPLSCCGVDADAPSMSVWEQFCVDRDRELLLHRRFRGSPCTYTASMKKYTYQSTRMPVPVRKLVRLTGMGLGGRGGVARRRHRAAVREARSVGASVLVLRLARPSEWPGSDPQELATQGPGACRMAPAGSGR